MTQHHSGCGRKHAGHPQWDLIKVISEKWAQEPWGNEGSGFVVVGIIGYSVLWYNDIEEGFNISSYSRIGVTHEYWCNHGELKDSVQQLQNPIESSISTHKLGPSQCCRPALAAKHQHQESHQQDCSKNAQLTSRRPIEAVESAPSPQASRPPTRSNPV